MNDEVHDDEFDCRDERSRGDEISGRGDINHVFLARRGRLLRHKGEFR